MAIQGGHEADALWISWKQPGCPPASACSLFPRALEVAVACLLPHWGLTFFPVPLVPTTPPRTRVSLPPSGRISQVCPTAPVLPGSWDPLFAWIISLSPPHTCFSPISGLGAASWGNFPRGSQLGFRDRAGLASGGGRCPHPALLCPSWPWNSSLCPAPATLHCRVPDWAWTLVS